MELLQLKYFCDAAKTENFSKTANKFNVPPSDISQTIKRLEKELSVNLFVRNANSISLSEKGCQFYKKVLEALNILNDAITEIADDGKNGKLNICINANRRIVMKTVEKFKKQFANVDIITKFFCDPAAEPFDLIISSEKLNLKNYKSQPLLSEGLAVAMSQKHPLANCNNFNIGSISSEPFITMSDKSSLYMLTKSICSDFGFVPHIAVQSDDPFYVRKCVELGLGIAIIPIFSWQGQFADSVILKPINGYERTTFAYINEKKYTPVCAKKFLEILTEECR